ncbi:hypothetical protein JCM10914A_43790 [Paenibacillus sp. JCM 10914]|uniref:hypothetical protein n=1 Tax=Paenibacillus sp. JCM 10914 TaxID=1236974 RepID=UPI0003CC4DE6|nr:hypothetical protein [Paenibacillus sp. JCM 10914]GAE07401.1 hypothetical protein JCM10914_3628 [Paenibacillus sp. JCM 10914]
MSQPTVPYHEIEPLLQTGDIFLAHGISKGSIIIETLEQCPWSHVAIVVRTPDNEVLLWESTSADDLEDCWFHVKKSGPQLVKLRDRIISDISGQYDSMFAIRQLEVERTPEMYDQLENFIGQVHDATFPDKLQMYWEVLEGKFGIKSSFKDFFCSKLASETYMRLGLLSESKPANSYEPKNFTSEHPLKLLKNAKLMNEIYIDPASVYV